MEIEKIIFWGSYVFSVALCTPETQTRENIDKKGVQRK
jgi:hypothetical protein